MESRAENVLLFVTRGKDDNDMFKENISRRDFLKGVGIGIAALNLPTLSPITEAATKRSSSEFYVSKIDDTIFNRIKGKSYKDNCTLPLEDLRYLHLLHKDINGVTQEGEMICNVYIAAPLIDIFQKLYANAYPIEKIRLVDEYDADDERSMRDNNSSCFNFRFISHTTRISKHGLGLAVDINTLYNPYINAHVR